MHPKDADRMANSVDPDQTSGAVWSGSTLFAQTYMSENFKSLWYLPFWFAWLRRRKMMVKGCETLRKAVLCIHLVMHFSSVLFWILSQVLNSQMLNFKNSNGFFMALITANEPSHEIMVLFVLRKLILQMCMPSHQMGLDLWFLVGLFVYFQTSCVWTAKALAWLRGSAGSPEPSLDACVISTIISWAGSNMLLRNLAHHSTFCKWLS